MMDLSQIIDLGRQTAMLTLVLAAPILLTGLVVALVVSILQAASGVQEQTLSFIPKIAAMIVAAVIAGPWMIERLLEFSRQMFGTLP